MTPRPSVAQIAASLPGVHLWGRWLTQDPTIEACLLCGVVRRADDGNKPCRGVVQVVVREVAG